jgi:hypothetical protein
MKCHLPVIGGLIERRILVNFRVVPCVLERILPPPFRPQLVHGWGMAGICLIRLRHMRPRGWPAFLGISSENAAHRIAVEWEANGELHAGVFIPRRDTSSWLNVLAGGRLFPGAHHQAEFRVAEGEGRFRIQMRGRYGTHLSLSARSTGHLPSASVFRSLEDASKFFERGSLGYSVTTEAGRFDGLALRSYRWQIEPLAVERIDSSFFADERCFPRGTVEFDNALLMRNIPHEWHASEPLCCEQEEICTTTLPV